jgi:hypothetical protein
MVIVRDCLSLIKKIIGVKCMLPIFLKRPKISNFGENNENLENFKHEQLIQF